MSTPQAAHRANALRLLALLVLAGIVAACGGSRGGEGTASGSTQPGGQPSVARKASDDGVTEDTITVGILVGDLDKLVQIGFASDIGDVRAIFESFLVAANAAGGVNGRQIDWVYEEFDLVAGEPAMREACERLYDRADPFVVLTSAGFVDGMPCVTDEHDTPVIAIESFPASAYADAGGNLFTMPASSQATVAAMVELLAGSGALEGKTLGVLYGDRPGMVETVETGLMPALERAGLQLAEKVQIIGPSSDPTVFGQFPPAIDKLKSAGVDGLFLLHDSFLSTNFLTAAAKAGYSPALYGSDYQHIADPTVLPFIVNYQAEAAFDGMLGVTYTRTGDDTSGASADPGDAGCAARYAASRSPDVPEYGTQRWAQLAVICHQVDVLVRALREAGPNPTRESFREAMTSLPSMHLGFGGQGSFAPGKQDAADEFRIVRYDASTKAFVPQQGFTPVGR
ncbi:MAG TPA: ABC transporter substrate-binding protein [Acidimicrobiales bacterium]